MTDILNDIVAKTRERLVVQKRAIAYEDLKRRSGQMPAARPFTRVLRQTGGIAVIAELKQSSPSAGVIREEPDLVGRIQAYARGGAAALSILTEEHYFRGSPHILETARKATPLPLLRKDFIVDPYQIEESRLMGADALLLIATLLPASLLKELLAHTQEAGLEALVEAHNEEDMAKALDAGATLIGVNHRDLRTLQMDMSISQRLLPLIPKTGKTIVIESGIRTPEELSRFRALGAHAALIGETLMRHVQPEAIVRAFVESGRELKRKSA